MLLLILEERKYKLLVCGWKWIGNEYKLQENNKGMMDGEWSILSLLYHLQSVFENRNTCFFFWLADYYGGPCHILGSWNPALVQYRRHHRRWYSLLIDSFELSLLNDQKIKVVFNSTPKLLKLNDFIVFQRL